jgi:predicted O-methyltransferase YrrM
VPWHLIWLTPKDCSLANLEPAESYDIIFIDAQKSGYPTYLKMILDKSQPGQPNRLLRPGGLIIGDNALRCGLVADESNDNPATKTVPRQTINWDWSSIAFLDEFNKLMHTHGRIEAMLLPVFDGLSMGRLLD